MKFRSIIAGAIALAISASLAFGQTNQGSSPLTGSKGGTNNGFMQFTGPATSLKTFTLPNASDTIATLAAIQTFSAAKTFNSATLLLAGSSSGTTTLNAAAAASGILTLPAATDTLVGKATTDTFTNKTFDTAGTGNSLSINSVAVTANTGTGAVARATSPVFVTPTLGAATATSINGNAFTAGTYTLTGAAGKTLTFSNSLTLAGTDATTLTFQGTDTYVGRATTDTLTNKTLTSPTLTTPSLGVATATSINKVAFTAPATGSTLTIPDGVTLTGPSSSGTAMTLGNAETVTGAKSFNDSTVILKGLTSGTTTVKSGAIAGASVITLPIATDTLVGKATTDTFTNKTFDTAGTGNSLSINSVAVTANTGTGAVARATSPVFVTPTLGAATATSINGNAFTAGTYTLTGAAGKTLTFSNSLTLAGTDATTLTFQGTDTYVGRATTDTLTNKTLTSPVIATIVNGGNNLTLPTSTDTLVGRATTDTLSNKSLTSPVTTGTVDVQETLKLSGDISPSQLVANTDNWAPTGFSTASAIRFSTDASRNITGLAGGADGRIIILHNVGSFDAVLINNSGSSSAGNKFLLAGDVTLGGDTSITLRYDATSTVWRAITTPGAGGGGGGVTSVGIAGAGLTVNSGTCTITTSGTCTLTTTAAVQSDQETGTSNTVAVTPGTQKFHPSSAKAWGYVTISGSTVTVTQGYNAGSTTYNAAGDYSIALSGFSAAPACTISPYTGNSGQNDLISTIFNQSATQIRARFYDVSAAALADVFAFSFVCYGDWT